MKIRLSNNCNKNFNKNYKINCFIHLVNTQKKIICHKMLVGTEDERGDYVQ